MDESLYKGISEISLNETDEAGQNDIDISKLVGKIINGYKCEKLIGKGKFGTVYIGSKNNRLFILKIVLESQFNNNELEVLKKISQTCKSYIPAYVDDFKINNYIIVITKYLENSIDLFDYIDRIHNENFIIKNKISDYVIHNNIITIIRMLIEHLDCMHSNNMVHMDIKPENILIQLDSQYMVTYATFIDFGLSCTKDIFDSTNGALCKTSGTLEYMAPELIDQYSKHYLKNNVTTFITPVTLNNYKKTDIWSLGLVLFLLITDKLPYELIPKKFGDYHDIIFYYKNTDDDKINIKYALTKHEYLLYHDFYRYLQFLISKMLRYSPSKRENINVIKQYLQ
jgi:serine/threonine protein kinase